VPHPGLFAVFEHQVQGLEGVELDNSQEDSGDEIWLRVARRSETPAPLIDDAVLEPWAIVKRHPELEPALRNAIQGRDLIEAGTHRSSLEDVAEESEERLPVVDPETTITLKSMQARTPSGGPSGYVDTAAPVVELAALARRSRSTASCSS
jgi:hypothetical protein